MLEGAQIKFIDAVMINGKAQRNGGAIYAGGTAGTPKIEIECNTNTML